MLFSKRGIIKNYGSYSLILIIIIHLILIIIFYVNNFYKKIQKIINKLSSGIDIKNLYIEDKNDNKIKFQSKKYKEKSRKLGAKIKAKKLIKEKNNIQLKNSRNHNSNEIMIIQKGINIFKYKPKKIKILKKVIKK